MTPRVTEEQYFNTHEKILRAAEVLFSRNGYNGTSMNDIVKESGVSKGAIYSHFENKESLYLELQEQQTAIGIDQLKSLFAPKDSAMQKLEKVIQIQFNNTCAVPEDNCRMEMEFLVTASRMDKLREKIKDNFEVVHQFGVDIINEGVKKGEIRQDIDVDSVVSILLAAMNGLSFLWLATGVPFDLEKVKNTFLTIVFKGIMTASRDIDG